MDRKGAAAKLAINCGIGGGVVQSSYALEDAAVEGLMLVKGGGGAGRVGPGFACV